MTSYFEIVEKSRKKKQKLIILSVVLLTSLAITFLFIYTKTTSNSQEKNQNDKQKNSSNIPINSSSSPSNKMLPGFYELPSPGGQLPAHETAGPLRVGGESNPIVSGFAHSELGAALAGLHLLERVRPYAGPSVFVPTIQKQMVGKDNDVQVYLDETNEAYLKSLKASPNQSQPILRTAQYVGYRITAYSDLYAVVQYLLEFPPKENNGSSAAKIFGQQVAVVWKDNDWLLMAQTDGKLAPIQTDVDPNKFIRFS